MIYRWIALYNKGYFDMNRRIEARISNNPFTLTIERLAGRRPATDADNSYGNGELSK